MESRPSFRVFSINFTEVLSAPDRELNAWASLKKTCMYRDDNDEIKDIEMYRSKANNVELKKKMLPSLYCDDGPEDALEAEKEKKASKSKTRRKQKRKSEHTAMQHDTHDEDRVVSQQNIKRLKPAEETTNILQSDKKSKRRKKKSTLSDDRSSLVKNVYGGSFNSSITKGNRPIMPKKSTDRKLEVNAEMKMSDKRLEAYGIAPNTFKRKKIKEKFRNEGKN